MPEVASTLVAETPKLPVSFVLTKISLPTTWATGLDSPRVIEGELGLVLSIRIVATAVRTGSTLPTSIDREVADDVHAVGREVDGRALVGAR